MTTLLLISDDFSNVSDNFLIFRKNNYFCKDIVIKKRFLKTLYDYDFL